MNKINKITKILFIAFFLSGCGGSNKQVSRKVEVLDLNGIKTKIESVDQELSKDTKPKLIGELKPIKPDTSVKTINRTPEVFEFESEGEGTATKYERMIDAQNRAEEDALSKAVKESGVNVYSGFQDVMQESQNFSYQFIGKYINVWANSLVSYERISEPDCKSEENLIRCKVKIKGKVYFRGLPDPVFELKASLDKPAYFAGDEINIHLLVSKDSYITILSCDEEGNVSVVFPNKYAENRLFKAGEEIIIPQNMGFKLKAYLPQGRKQTVEMLHIIAIKSQPLILDSMLKEQRQGDFITYPLGGLKDLALKLSKFERQDWTTQVIIYEIKEK